MFGIYYINHGDTHWTRFTSTDTEPAAERMLVGLKQYMTINYGAPLCVAISRGQDAPLVERKLLGASQCE